MAKAIISGQVKHTRSVHIMVAVNLYLIELDAGVSGLGEYVRQSSEVCEPEEWEGLSDDADTQASAGHGFSGGIVNVEDLEQHSQSTQEGEGKDF
jgi:hypothetical protein